MLETFPSDLGERKEVPSDNVDQVEASTDLAQVPWPEAVIWLREICCEVTEEDLQEFESWAIAWPGGVDADVVTINGLSFYGVSPTDPFVNPTTKLLDQEQIKEIGEIEYGSALALIDPLEVSSFLYRQARFGYFDRELFTKKGLVHGETMQSGLPEFEGLYNYSMNMTHGGWGVEIRFDSADFPEFESILEEIEKVKVARVHAVQKYISEADAPTADG